MIFGRELLEAREAQLLAPYGLKSRDSRGRAHQPDPEPEDRTAFQRDRDRILHTTAFRRLEYKTQVFINYEGDYYRTRLTHTLEVAQIGRTVARSLGANEDLVEAICLAHDLGHSPFGHAGEVALDELMQDRGGFDHNKQSLRIVTKLEQRYPNWPGLNLTWEAREGIVKHETEYDVADASQYDPEKRGHLEAQIANAADELAYTAHDLDDGLRAGLITPGDLKGLGLWEYARDSIGWHGEVLDQLTRHRLIRRLIGLEVADLVGATHARLEAAGVQSVEALQRLDHNVIGWGAELAARNRELKRFLYANMYRHYRVARMEAKANRVLADLFAAYTRKPDQLPKETRQRAEVTGDLHRAVCDYLAGMTDRFALDEHYKLFDPYTLP
ncbi:MAG: deoxyguanosinetriphosphate triphosphohydrolase [Anaerolineales bacterium]|nr:deoxyguanosinetriphosphate triphosphohydrolase [Anaerolineales bacterium]